MMRIFFIYLLISFLAVVNAVEKKNESSKMNFAYNTKQFFRNGTFTVGTGIHYYFDEHIKDAMASVMPLNFDVGYFISDTSFMEFEYLFHPKNLGYAGSEHVLIQRFHDIQLKYRYIPFMFNEKKQHGFIIGSTFEYMKIKTNYLPGGNHTQSNISADAGFIFNIYRDVILEITYRYPVLYFDHTGKLTKIKNARDASNFSMLLKYKFN